MRQRYASASAEQISPIDFSMKLLDLWGGKLVIRKGVQQQQQSQVVRNPNPNKRTKSEITTTTTTDDDDDNEDDDNNEIDNIDDKETTSSERRFSSLAKKIVKQQEEEEQQQQQWPRPSKGRRGRKSAYGTATPTPTAASRSERRSNEDITEKERRKLKKQVAHLPPERLPDEQRCCMKGIQIELDKFEDFIVNTEKMKPRAQREYVGMAKELISGVGITHKQWPTGAIFHPTAIDLGEDFTQLYIDAKDIQKLHGHRKCFLTTVIRELANYQKHYYEHEMSATGAAAAAAPGDGDGGGDDEAFFDAITGLARLAEKTIIRKRFAWKDYPEVRFYSFIFSFCLQSKLCRLWTLFVCKFS